MKDLVEYFYSPNAGRRQVHKFPHYLDVYDRFFSRFRDTACTVVEIGVDDGGSLQMWRDYFGPKAKIYGLDKSCPKMNEEQITLVTCDQSKAEDLRRFRDLGLSIDVIIDDGSHKGEDQILTFNELFPLLSAEGVYACEDLHTNYNEYFCHESFVEYVKKLSDIILRGSREDDSKFMRDFRNSVYGIHFYHVLCIIEKSSKVVGGARLTGGNTDRTKY